MGGLMLWLTGQPITPTILVLPEIGDGGWGDRDWWFDMAITIFLQFFVEYVGF